MKIVILSGSPRPGGNTDMLVEAFVRGASLHNDVEVINVRERHIAPCLGCNRCFDDAQHRCCQRDDMAGVYESLAPADMLVIASPVYFYSLSAQLKAVIDRLHNPLRDTFSVRQMALLLVGASSKPDLFDSLLLQYRKCLDFFGLADAGCVLASGVKAKGDIAGHHAINQAYDLGASLR